ncbi:hypothetical protein [uncultured Dialister sp.]|uniref:hypothetical protein n=1 Tax=uncultured Dialister sp. TaxID=278064 RepID=UPI00265D35F7|nr:hypothetical protein [uncultured Dialister sp.]
MEIVYRCTQKCPIHKHCFILKVPIQLKEPLLILLKCKANNGKDIPVIIGNKSPPI